MLGFLDSLTLARTKSENKGGFLQSKNSGRHYRSKKGEMTIGKLVAIILAIVILTLSVYAITKNKALLHEKISSFTSESTLDDLVLACNNQAQMNQENNFCCESKTLITDDLNQEITCPELAQMQISNNRINGPSCEETVC